MAARILVVDDQRSNVEMLAGVLKARGYVVHSALDGQQALELVREIHPDLVLSDILMPNVDGYDLCRRLRAAPETALLPVILVTSLDAQGERIKGLEAGAASRPSPTAPIPTRCSSCCARITPPWAGRLTSSKARSSTSRATAS